MNNKTKINCILCVAKMELRKWITLKNFIILLFSAIFLGEYVYQDMLYVAQITNLRINMLEPFDLVMSFQFYIMVIPLVFCVLLSEFPDNSTKNVFIFSRLDRVTWLCGQLLFGILAGIICLIFFVFTSFIWIGTKGEFSNHWSTFMTNMYTSFPEVYSKYDRLFLESGTMSHGTPIGVAVICIGLMLCYFIILLQILCIFHLCGHKKIGLLLSMLVTIVGVVAVSYMDNVVWFFPVTHAIFGAHFDKFYAQPKFRIEYSLVYFFIVNAILFALNVYLVKKCRIGDE